jgi:hypothetical protein
MFWVMIRTCASAAVAGAMIPEMMIVPPANAASPRAKNRFMAHPLLRLKVSTRLLPDVAQSPRSMSAVSPAGRSAARIMSMTPMPCKMAKRTTTVAMATFTRIDI